MTDLWNNQGSAIVYVLEYLLNNNKKYLRSPETNKKVKNSFKLSAKTIYSCLFVCKLWQEKIYKLLDWSQRNFYFLCVFLDPGDCPKFYREFGLHCHREFSLESFRSVYSRLRGVHQRNVYFWFRNTMPHLFDKLRPILLYEYLLNMLRSSSQTFLSLCSRAEDKSLWTPEERNRIVETVYLLDVGRHFHGRLWDEIFWRYEIAWQDCGEKKDLLGCGWKCGGKNDSNLELSTNGSSTTADTCYSQLAKPTPIPIPMPTYFDCMLLFLDNTRAPQFLVRKALDFATRQRDFPLMLHMFTSSSELDFNRQRRTFSTWETAQHDKAYLLLFTHLSWHSFRDMLLLLHSWRGVLVLNDIFGILLNLMLELAGLEFLALKKKPLGLYDYFCARRCSNPVHNYVVNRDYWRR